MSLSPSEDIKKTTCFGAYTEKKILNGISIYFNPGQLTGIMGPSGRHISTSGKKKLLHLEMLPMHVVGLSQSVQTL